MELNLGDLAVTAPAFNAGQPIPDRFSNEGGDVSPELRWSDVPDGSAELVVIVHDPDAPLVGGFTHWVATGIDPGSTGLPEGANDGFTAGLNETGEPAYMGPAPPPGHGDHHYFFELYALDTTLDASSPMSRRQVLDRIEGHVIEQARIVGTYRIDEGS